MPFAPSPEGSGAEGPRFRPSPIHPPARRGAWLCALVALLGCVREVPADAGLALPGSGLPDAGWTEGSQTDGVQGAVDGAARSPDAAPGDGGEGDGGQGDGGQGQGDADAGPPPPPKVCVPGLQRCEGVQLATCTPAGDGWAVSPCFAGEVCEAGQCAPLSNNLVLVFDTSGSMGVKVSGKTCPIQTLPACDPAKGCSRMDVSKLVFKAVLDKIPTATTKMALFRFPQRLGKTKATSCTSGHYVGIGKLSGDTAGAQSVDAASSWYWDYVDQILCVPYPRTTQEATQSKAAIALWMDGKETVGPTATACASTSSGCKAAAACGGGGCCGGKCWGHAEQPELRASGGTPIGKTLFYVGEYLRNRVIVDGLPCVIDGDCASPHYRCVQGWCVDPARDCRDTVVVLFTDGGENNDPASFFAPQVSAKRLAWGLACKSTADCVGGASCSLGRCRLPGGAGHYCLGTGKPCKPSAAPGGPLYCPTKPGQPLQCLPDPTKAITAQAEKAAHNVLRSPDGRPFRVRLHVVDISGSTSLSKSFYLSVAGGGRLLTADAADPDSFIAALKTAMDMKNKKVCGTHQ